MLFLARFRHECFHLSHFNVVCAQIFVLANLLHNLWIGKILGLKPKKVNNEQNQAADHWVHQKFQCNANLSFYDCNQAANDGGDSFHHCQCISYQESSCSFMSKSRVLVASRLHASDWIYWAMNSL